MSYLTFNSSDGIVIKIKKKKKEKSGIFIIYNLINLYLFTFIKCKLFDTGFADISQMYAACRTHRRLVFKPNAFNLLIIVEKILVSFCYGIILI